MDEEEVIDALGIRDRVGTFVPSSPNSSAFFGRDLRQRPTKPGKTR